MEPRKWKRIAFTLCVICLLIFTFWYGGGASNLRGFSVSEEQTEMTAQEENEAGNDDSSLSKADSAGEALEKKENTEGNVFEQFFMHITKKSSSKNTSNKNTQNSKNAQKNANKAADKAQSKKNSKKKTTSQNSNSKDNSSNGKQANNGYNDNQSDNGGQDTQPGNGSDNTKGNNTQADTKTDSNANKNTENSNSTNQSATTSQDTVSCTISISCATLLDHLDELTSAKKKQVPEDGVIIRTTTVEVKKGSTVFDVLQSVTKKKKIHLEYSFTPAFKSYYIEGIHNLYEFDCGELSGWMYSVNGEFPGEGCSSYTVENGDVIQWVYTCSLGKDVGGYFEE